jgi:ParB family chromosome partitioning protein|tara:strand:- start:3271 stop:4158 length:888 start_codon:yes stop_codon:yes gene_type:complete
VIDKKVKRKVLGRGLSALMADVNPVVDGNKDEDNKGLITLSVDQIEPNPNQPRRTFSTDSLMDLSNSIIEKGIIQPLIVRAISKTPVKYQIVAGERRWRAAQMAKLHKIPVVVRSFSDVEVLEIAIIENIQRSDLSPIDEANGYQQLIDRFNHTQDKISRALGKSRSHIANLLRLLNLPNDVQTLLNSGALSIGHARALITRKDASLLAKEIIRKKLSVREVEKLVKIDFVEKQKSSFIKRKDADTREIEANLKASIGMRVDINHNTLTEAGELKIKYKSLDQLDFLINKLEKQS